MIKDYYVTLLLRQFFYVVHSSQERNEVTHMMHVTLISTAYGYELLVSGNAYGFNTEIEAQTYAYAHNWLITK